MTDTPETLRAFAKRRRRAAEDFGKQAEQLEILARHKRRKEHDALKAAESNERKADALENQPEKIGATG